MGRRSERSEERELRGAARLVALPFVPLVAVWELTKLSGRGFIAFVRALTWPVRLLFAMFMAVLRFCGEIVRILMLPLVWAWRAVRAVVRVLLLPARWLFDALMWITNVITRLVNAL